MRRRLQSLLCCNSCRSSTPSDDNEANGIDKLTAEGVAVKPSLIARTQIHNGQPKRTCSGSTTRIIPAAHGYATVLNAGTSFRLIDLHGKQVIDMSAFVLPFPDHGMGPSIASAEHFSPSYTLYHTSGQPVSVGEYLYTNMDQPLFKLAHDTVRTHDMTFMSCFPKLYEAKGFKSGEHRSCAENMLEALAEYGMKSLTEVRDPFNVFQNTPNYTLKPLNTSKPGDWCEFEVLIDCVVAWSCCPYDLDHFNGGKITDALLVTGLQPGSTFEQAAEEVHHVTTSYRKGALAYSSEITPRLEEASEGLQQFSPSTSQSLLTPISPFGPPPTYISTVTGGNSYDKHARLTGRAFNAPRLSKTALSSTSVSVPALSPELLRPRSDKICPHGTTKTCLLSSGVCCCACADTRPPPENEDELYETYVDGHGLLRAAKRWKHYCPKCVEYFKTLKEQ